MRLTRVETIGTVRLTGVQTVYVDKFAAGRAEEGAPRVLASVTLRSGSPPPVFDLSRAEIGEVKPTGRVGGRFAVVDPGIETAGPEVVVVLRHRVAEVGVRKVVVVEVHVDVESTGMRSWVSGEQSPLSNVPIFISPGREAGYAATFFHSFQELLVATYRTPIARRWTPPASCFLCGRPAATVASVKPSGSRFTGRLRMTTEDAGHETPPRCTDPILSWFSFQVRSLNSAMVCGLASRTV